METKYKGNRDEVKLAMKSYSNGYRIAKFMSFGDSAKKTLDLPAGSVIALLNPKKLEQKKAELTSTKQQNSVITFCIENENQVIQLGLSRNYDVCDGETEHP
jgi:hypothetical protein